VTATDDLPIPFATWDPPTIEVGPAPSVADREVRWVHRDDRVVVVKCATGRARAELRREATVLRVLSGTSVVDIEELVDLPDRTELVLVEAGRRTLAGSEPLPVPTLERALVATCRAVAELHVRGWSHGAIEAGHVVIAGRSGVRLCSLRRSVRTSDDPDAERRDVVALLDLVRRSVDRPVVTSDWRRRLAWSCTRRRIHRLCSTVPDGGAPALVDGLARAVGPRQGRWRPHLVVASAIAILLAGVITLGRPLLDRTEPSGAAEGAVTMPRVGDPHCADDTAGTADTDGDGCGNEVAVDGPLVTVDGVRFQMGTQGDVVVVGDWDCDGAATPALLRPSTGEVFRFSGWAGRGEALDAERAGVVPGARSLTTAVDPQTRCEHLVVGLDDGSTRDITADR
jgi:hypothetical protein